MIFGKNGHAEVLGLVGQTESHAIVVEKFEDVKQLKETGQLDFSKDIYLYSQTTKSLDEFHRIIEYCQEHIVEGAVFKSFDTICRQVANRMPNIAAFASKHDVILFVSGRKSSNGKVLFKECKSVNANSYQIESADEIDMNWLKDVETVISTGGSSLKAVEALRKNGNEIVGMVASYTYGFPIAEKAFADANVKLVTLTDYEHVVAEALETGYIKQEDVELLHEWRKDPANWKK